MQGVLFQQILSDMNASFSFLHTVSDRALQSDDVDQSDLDLIISLTDRLLADIKSLRGLVL